jgi:hypothetical protein
MTNAYASEGTWKCQLFTGIPWASVEVEFREMRYAYQELRWSTTSHRDSRSCCRQDLGRHLNNIVSNGV